MNKSLVTIATATSFLLIGGIAQASVKETSVKPAKLTSKSTYVKGTGTKSATIKLSRYHVTYASGKISKQGKFSFKLKHKLHAGWKYRLTITKKGYKTFKTYVKITSESSSPQNTPIISSTNSFSVTTATTTSTTNTTAPSTTNTTSSAAQSSSSSESSTISSSSDSSNADSSSSDSSTSRDALYAQIKELEEQVSPIDKKLNPMQHTRGIALSYVENQESYDWRNQELTDAEKAKANLDPATATPMDIIRATDNINNIKASLESDHEHDTQVKAAQETINNTPDFEKTYQGLHKQSKSYWDQIHTLQDQLDALG